jgi:hypothetical protein
MLIWAYTASFFRDQMHAFISTGLAWIFVGSIYILKYRQNVALRFENNDANHVVLRRK